MSDVAWHLHPDPEHMAAATAADVLSSIEGAVVACGRALIAVPGGRSPLPIFEELTLEPAPWDRVTIMPTDDRAVPAGSPLSNFSMIAHYFAPLGAHLVPLATGDDDYRRAAQAANARLGDLHWPPDLIWLGMGADGHTASIFPGPDYASALETIGARRPRSCPIRYRQRRRCRASRSVSRQSPRPLPLC